MEYEERIDSVQGSYIVASNNSFEDILLKEPIELCFTTVNPGEETNLGDWFNRKVKYVGMLPSEDHKVIKKAVFYIGKGESDLFQEGAEYYDLTLIIAPNRIGKVYKAGTFRDCFWLKRKGNKYYWK